MRTQPLVALIAIVWLAVSCSAQAPATAPRPDDPSRQLVLVEQPKPVPAPWRAGFDSITAADAGVWIRFLSADALDGRETATTGHEAAAEFVAALLAAWGVAPAGDPVRAEPAGAFAAGPAAPRPAGPPVRSYFQRVPIREIRSATSRITVGRSSGAAEQARTFQSDLDYQFPRVRRTEVLRAPVVFVGYGIRETAAGWDDYRGVDVKGKVVLVLNGAPRPDDPASPFHQPELKDKYTGARPRRTASPKVAAARELGALAVLQVESDAAGRDVAARVLDGRVVDDSKPVIDTGDRELELPEPAAPLPMDALPTLTVSREMAAYIVGLADAKLDGLKADIDGKLQPASRELAGVTLELRSEVSGALTSSRNVLGFVEGSDPKLKDEVVVIGAHLDHLGHYGPYIFNGADDNASGAAGLLEIAQAYATGAARPKRSVLFAFWTGEEQGLLGSRYYADHPFMPMDRTAACVNLDMLGRSWTKERLERVSRMWGIGLPEDVMAKIKVEEFMALSLSETDAMDAAIRAANSHVGMALYLRPSRGAAAGGSDHAPFAQRNIPWTFFFSAMTEDYHTPG
ncbi:MAG: M20/M25/M40 family metallo-hydrolase, partial [Acidobacteria bacterium]|nr:M20/M25/M40 family metallo-hydrolase [Acidobacteriota bacterium]